MSLKSDLPYLSELETLDTGHPIRDTKGLDVPRTAAAFRYFGGIADKVQGTVVPVESGFLNYVTREPLGCRRYRAMEFPPAVHELEDGPGARRGKHNRVETSGTDAAQHAPDRG